MKISRRNGFWLVLPGLLIVGLLAMRARRLNAMLLVTASQSEPAETATLLDKGANVNVKNPEGDTPLHLAVLSSGNLLAAGGVDNIATIKILVQHGASPNALNNEGDGPLHYAIICESPTSVQALLELGARVNVRSRRYGTPLHQAKTAAHRVTRRRLQESQLIKIIYLLRAFGADD